MIDDREQLADELLLMDAQDGDARAMDQLVCRWQRRLWRYAYRLTSSAEGAWEITQESWLGIIRGLSRLHDPARFRPWAYRIVTNKANDWLRRRAKARQSSGRAPLDRREPDGQRAAEAIIDLQDALPQLSGVGRTVMTLHYLEGLSLEEVAEAIRVPRGTVKSRLHAARNELRSLLETHEKGEIR